MFDLQFAVCSLHDVLVLEKYRISDSFGLCLFYNDNVTSVMLFWCFEIPTIHRMLTPRSSSIRFDMELYCASHWRQRHFQSWIFIFNPILIAALPSSQEQCLEQGGRLRRCWILEATETWVLAGHFELCYCCSCTCTRRWRGEMSSTSYSYVRCSHIIIAIVLSSSCLFVAFFCIIRILFLLVICYVP